MKVTAPPIATALTVATVVAAALGFVLVPAGTRLPIHWGLTGAPDALAGREPALLMPVLFLAAVWGLIFGVDRLIKRQTERSRIGARLSLTLFSAIFCAIAMVNLLNGIGIEANLVRAFAIAAGGLMVVQGGMIATIPHRSIAGFRFGPAMADAANWQMTHRFISQICVMCGVILLLGAVLAPMPLLLAVFVLCCLSPYLAGLWRSHRRA